MKVFFTSDLHLFHDNIIKYCKRPFKNVAEMHETIKKNWNSVVAPNDSVYVLGDICFSRYEHNADQYLEELNGTKYLIKGNHDRKLPANIFSKFVWVKDYYRLSVGEQDIILMHYALRVWDKSHHGSWHLYGHSHGNLPEDPNALSMDVGVDANNFTPVSFEQVKERMAKKTFVPIDHHGRKKPSE